MSSSLFISYGHKDMEPLNWLERLKLYLAPLRRRELVDYWDDTRIEPGGEWRREIGIALEQAASAVLLVGPGFLASDFINDFELSPLLDRVKSRGGHIYPLIIGYSGYERSVLGKYQAFNKPESPLEAVLPAEQNRILNNLSLAIDQDLRYSQPATKSPEKLLTDARGAMKEIAIELRTSRTAFVAQARRRDRLVQALMKRFEIGEHLEYEKFFFRYYDKLNAEERFEFDQIRAMTEGPLYESNTKMLDVMQRNPQVLDEMPSLADLRQHLVFWLNKYEKIFVKTLQMCLVYVGVEDGVPFPAGLDERVVNWLQQHP